MKFMTLLLFLSVFRVTANYSQVLLNLNMEKTAIKNVLKEIEHQSEFTFIYDNTKINVNKEVSISLEGKTINETLDELFDNTEISYEIVGNQIPLMNKFTGEGLQEILISGVITSSDTDEPLPGVNITVKGTTTGTITDLDGAYQIAVPGSDAILVFQFVGYLTEEIPVGEQTTINVSMVMDIVQLNEIVVVGYGTMRKQDLTGSISSVSAEELNTGVITTTEQVLQGKVAGLTVIRGSGDVSSGATMRLRGGTSLTASSSPLIVVDGIPGVDINTIQPSDIVSIDVLKDASAAAIYGSRGANGVIMITTTRPEKGKKVEYSNYFAFGKAASSLDLLTADEWRQKVEEYEETGARDMGSDTDWQKEITQNSFTHSHTLSFSNHRDDGGYRASLTYLNAEGIVKTNTLERLGANLYGYTYALNDKLKLDFGVNTTFDKFNPVNSAVFERAYTVNPTAPIYDSLGNYFQQNDQLTENPVEILMTTSDDKTTKRILGFAKAELEIVTGLMAVLNTSYEYNSQQGRYYLPTYSKFGSSDRGYANRNLSDYRNLQLETYLTYNKELESGHRFNIMGGYSYLDNTYEGFGSERRGYDTDMFLYNNLQAGDDVRSTDVYSYKGNAKLISFFGRVNYNYRSRYSFTATLRRDGSSRFGKNNKWGLFPSFAAAWTVSNEAFMSSSNGWLNHLKIRAGYGITGSQDAIGEYTTIALLGIEGGMYYDPATGKWKSSYSPIQNANPDLKWETTTQTNIGIDFSLINRLSATIDIYNKLTSDLIFLYSVPQPPNLYPETLANVGELSNKGVEFTLNWNVMQRNELHWDVNLTMARNTLKIEKLTNDQFEDVVAVQSGDLHGLPGLSNQFSQTIREGYAVGTFWGPECFGLDEDGKFILDTADTDLGNAQPKFSLGLSTGLTYKGFDFSISAYGLFGQKVLNATAMANNDLSRFPEKNVPNRVFTDSITSSPTFSSYWVEDASFFRIQTVTLGYTFNFKNIAIKKLRLYATAENLFVFTKYTGLDPEIKIEEYDTAKGKMDALKNPGIDRYDVYPKARIFSVGLSVIF